jgi:hypothetical protein
MARAVDATRVDAWAWVAKLAGWTNPSPGLFRRVYERRRLGVTEQSTLELRVVTP